MTADALTRIRARGHIGIRLGLARMSALLSVLGDPQLGLRGALIGGTNGKGSVAAMVASVMDAAGYSTSQSPSPHLHSYRERIIVDGVPIAAPDLDRLLEEVLAASQPGEAEHGPATEFELLTAAFYLWSARQAVDVVVMEVGLGGRLDASNAWAADVAAVTNVGMDHQEYLGTDVRSIATEKAAIIKPGCRAVTGADGEALEVIAARADEVGVPLSVRRPLPITRLSSSGSVLDGGAAYGPIELSLLGPHQAANASVAIGVIEALAAAGVASADAGTTRRGLADTRWPARLELRSIDGQIVLFDGAHNPEGVGVMVTAVEAVADELPSGPPVLLLGVMADKEVAAMVQALVASAALRAAQVVTTSVPDTDRSLSAAALAATWERAAGRPADAVEDDPAVALTRALGLAGEGGGPLIVLGSLYLVGAVRARLLPDEVPRP